MKTNEWNKDLIVICVTFCVVVIALSIGIVLTEGMPT